MIHPKGEVWCHSGENFREKFMDKRKLNDFLFGKENVDTHDFAREVEKDSGLREGLRGLEEMDMSEEVKPDRVKIWHGMSVEIRKRGRLARLRWMRAAAVLAAGFVGAGVWGLLGDLERNAPEEEEMARQVQLVLSDGRAMSVESDTLIREEEAEIRVSRQGGADYTEKRHTERLVYNTIRVPRGNEYHVVLSDNTEVWLNSESELRFPVNFVGGERRVFLKGEAFFAVERDTARPFFVEADEMRLEVLGTSFNVNAYRDNGNLLATLVEGKVRVTDTLSGRSCVLSPGCQAEMGGGRLDTCRVRVEDVVAWKEGRFLFREMPLARIAKELERWFDVEVLFADQSLREHPFTGVVKRYNTIEEVCALIEETTNVKFVIRDRTVTVVRRE